NIPARRPEVNTDKRIADSLNRVIDSLEMVIQKSLVKKKKGKDEAFEEESESAFDHSPSTIDDKDFADDDPPSGPVDAGTDLVLRNMSNGQEKTFTNVLEYYFSEKGGKLLIEQAKNPKDSLSRLSVLLVDLSKGTTKTLSKSGNDFKSFSFSEDGSQVAYLAERDAKPKDLQKFYRLWYYKDGMDTAVLLADKNAVGMKLGMTVSEFGNISFSKSGKRLFFGVAPIQPPRDTTIIDIDMPKLDIWHYNDDYLQTVQTYPARLRMAQQENFMAVYDLGAGTLKQLGSKEMPQVLQTNEGDGDNFIGVTDFGKRIESQWLGGTLKDIYSINVATGERKLVKEKLLGQVYPSPTGKYLMWYDRKAKHYFVWDGKTPRNISEKIKTALWNEDSQVPDEPGPYGVMRWLENDEVVFVYDRYSVWKLDPEAKQKPSEFIGDRINKVQYRYNSVDPEERFISSSQTLVFKTFNEANKKSGLLEYQWSPTGYTKMPISMDSAVAIEQVMKAKRSEEYLYSKETFQRSPDIYIGYVLQALAPADASTPQKTTQFVLSGTKLSHINAQQSNYLWGTSELFTWKAYNGKEATGIVYKPENFDPKKKYPMIVYFYEKLSQGLNDYKDPAPIRSAVNVPYFVSNGYIIFMPDINYTTGHPGKNAYDYIVSGARALVKKGWVDSTNMALQGHSWGGYQAAQVATMTKMFKAIWAGAPVANMTSAYGGIRWESGVSRQFQYEKTQSRIGATLWEKPQLYIENSPLFHLNKVTAPMVIMANDADGAVPWYQGIELFSGLRRLGKKVWMFNYNGQGHGLTQRQDMRDYQIRMQQFFDWILKGEKPAKWITEGVPAVKKGKEWGLEIVD
ncbi:MAG TPA: prolyl oligopeptidase family serine peptidase, partial [Chitinophagaceae bacterium]